MLPPTIDQKVARTKRFEAKIDYSFGRSSKLRKSYPEAIPNVLYTTLSKDIPVMLPPAIDQKVARTKRFEAKMDYIF